MVFVLISVVLLAVGMAVTAFLQMQSKAAMEASVAAVPAYHATQQHISASGGTGVSVDEHSRTLCLVTSGRPPMTRVIAYRDLLGAELLEDGESVTSTSRGKQAGRAVVGGLLLGPVGLLAGALTATKTTHGNVHRIELKIMVNDTANPIHVVNFLSGVHDKSGTSYKAAIASARTWHARLIALMAQAARRKISTSTAASHTASAADELLKLADLRGRGILTDAQFERQKRLVLRPSGGRPVLRLV